MNVRWLRRPDPWPGAEAMTSHRPNSRGPGGPPPGLARAAPIGPGAVPGGVEQRVTARRAVCRSGIEQRGIAGRADRAAGQSHAAHADSDRTAWATGHQNRGRAPSIQKYQKKQYVSSESDHTFANGKNQCFAPLTCLRK